MRAADLLETQGYVVEQTTKHGRAHLRITGNVEGTFSYHADTIALGLLYPSADFFRPMVLLEGAIISRHQNVQSGELCVMDNSEDAWDPDEHDELFLVSQALRLLRDSEAGDAAVREAEIGAPEPVAPQVSYEANSRAFLPDLGHIEGAGVFDGLLSLRGPGPPTFVLTALDRVAIPKMLRMAGLVGAVRSIRGVYRTVNAAPTAADLISPNATTAWLLSQLGDVFKPYRLMDKRLRTASAKNPLTQVAMVVYPDEAMKRGGKRRTALVHIEEGEGQKSGVRRAVFAPQVFPANGDFVRMPGCEPLAGKHVAVIGCGAVGSMIAAALCRVGVGRFTLVDIDVLHLDNLVRHECNLWSVGLGKAFALAQYLFAISPLIDIEAWPERFGNIGDPRYPSHFDDVATRLRDADVVICAAGGEALSATVSAALPDRLIVHTWIGGGAVGGRILKEMPGSACFECFRYHAAHLGELPDNGEDPIYPTGCGFPTFTGRMYDIELTAQWATKVTVTTMLGEDAWTASDNAFVVDNQGGVVRHQLLTPHQSCSRHGTYCSTPSVTTAIAPL